MAPMLPPLLRDRTVEVRRNRGRRLRMNPPVLSRKRLRPGLSDRNSLRLWVNRLPSAIAKLLENCAARGQAKNQGVASSLFDICAVMGFRSSCTSSSHKRETARACRQMLRVVSSPGLQVGARRRRDSR